MSELIFNRFHTSRKFNMLVIIFLVLTLPACLAQASKDKVSLTSSQNTILIKTMVYQLKLDKKSGYAYLSNQNGISYTSFPLDVQFNLTEQRTEDGIDRDWKIKDKEIIVTAGVGNITTQQIKIIFYDHAFEIQIKSLVPKDVTGIGAYLFHRNSGGFDNSTWDQYFSPEPDDYVKANPQIDVRADRDQQWVFTPAPLNLSFKTRAGWFSVGLRDLPDASIYGFKHHALWLDFAWDRLRFERNQLYQFPSIIFTFNRSAWDAVGDYTKFILRSNGIAPGSAQRLPAWWKWPLVSTWGEQRANQISDDHPNFNSQWVKDYVIQQQYALDNLKFNVIIENKWALNDGDPAPSDRFQDLRNLIDWCHERGLKVILFWNAWKVEARALPVRMGVIDGEYIDATHPLFESYVDSCCQMLFGKGPGQLDADGLKIDRLFLTRDPSKANYANSSLGIGVRETHRYLQSFYRTAKKYKPDALLISSAIDPHFADVQDMVRVNDDWDNKIVREKRARIITQALPGMLIDGDAADLPAAIALYHYVTSMMYGVPSIQYLTRFHDAPIRAESRSQIVNLLKLYQLKPDGLVQWVDYGNWQIIDKNGKLLAESLPAGKGVLVFESNNQAKLLCVENNSVHLLLDRHQLKSIKDASGNQIQFHKLGEGIYELLDVELNKLYQVQLSPIGPRRRR